MLSSEVHLPLSNSSFTKHMSVRCWTHQYSIQSPATTSHYMDEVCIELDSRRSFTHWLLAGAPHFQHGDQHIAVPGSSRLTYYFSVKCIALLLQPHSKMACKDNGEKESCSLCKILSLHSHYASSGI